MVNVTVALNAVEEWTLTNVGGGLVSVDHPFHIHINPFQVIAVNGVALPVPEWHDTINIPHNNGSVTMRTRFKDFVGTFVFHCHILGHEDTGMMFTVNVV